MNRTLAFLVIGLLLALVLADPYTLFRSGSDSVAPAPWWQFGLGASDVLLLATVGWFTWRKRFSTAFGIAVLEGVFCVTSGVLFLAMEGRRRFFFGSVGDYFLMIYLAEVALRYVLLFLIAPHRWIGQLSH